MGFRRAGVVVLLLGALLLGCKDDADDSANAPANPTYYDHVAAILSEHCVSCHNASGIGPFPLDTFDSAAAVAGAIKGATADRRMPPFPVDGSGECNTFRDARLLDATEIKTLGNWADTGAPAGETREVPAPPAPPKLDRVSVKLDPGEPYTPATSVDDDYRCFVVEPGNDDDVFLTGYEVHPGTPRQVHHVVVYSTDTQAEADKARSLDAAQDGLGYTCFGGAETGGGRTLAVWAPGTGATEYPKDTGLRVMGGLPLVVQVHYNKPTEPDRTTVDLRLEKSVPKEALITSVFDLGLSLSPGNETETETATLPVPATPLPYRIHGVYPHMHTLGRNLTVTYNLGIGEQCLVDVPRYSFGWQQFFFYEEPVVIPANLGATVSIRCEFDTRGVNKTVTWGEGTEDEMCIAALYVTL